jgi:formate hydrogenlyase subunit 3/multisubunit Na+/H+ antiporter MnhD subunit
MPNSGLYAFLFFLLSIFLTLTFVVANLFFFYVSFELVTLLMYFIIIY